MMTQKPDLLSRAHEQRRRVERIQRELEVHQWLVQELDDAKPDAEGRTVFVHPAFKARQW
jgi:hypothetical protein